MVDVVVAISGGLSGSLSGGLSRGGLWWSMVVVG